MQTGSGPFSAGIGGNGSKSYRCSECNSVITYADRIIAVSGSKRHSFTNPAGVFCDFFTFSSCPGAFALGDPIVEHSWFPGYGWSLALCLGCGNHLGWLYKEVSTRQEVPEFWGILVTQVLPLQGVIEKFTGQIL
jgi:hypothetical protein